MESTIAKMKTTWNEHGDMDCLEIEMINQDDSGPWRFENAIPDNNFVPMFTNNGDSYFFFISWAGKDSYKLIMIASGPCEIDKILINQVFETGEELVKAVEDYFNKKFVEWHGIRNSII